MGWLDFGQALYLNASTAAGTLAETKLALREEVRAERREDRADRTLALQEESQKATVAYQKAKLAFDEWATTQDQVLKEEELAYKNELFEWQKGEQDRLDSKRIKDTKAQVAAAAAKAQNEQRIKDEAAEKKRVQAEKDREELKQSYLGMGMSEEEATVAANQNVPDAVESKIATEAMNRMRLRKLHPDKTEEEINAMYNRIYGPESKEELSASVKLQRELADIDRMEAEGTIDADTADLLRKGVHKRIAGTGTGTDATQRKLAAIDAEYGPDGRTPDPIKHRQARDAALGVPRETASKDGEGKSKVEWLDSFEIGTANREMLENIAINVPTEAADKDLIRSFGSILAGSTGPSDIDENRKRAVAGRAELYLRGNRPEGEAGSKLYEAQDYTLAELPELWEDLQNMDAEDFGKIDEAHERIARGLGTSSDYAITRFDSKIKALVNRWVRVESGAAITENELARLRELLPSIGNNWQVNMEILRTIGGMFTRSKQREYNLHFGEEWGAAIGEIQLQSANDMAADIGSKHPTMENQADDNLQDAFGGE